VPSGLSSVFEFVDGEHAEDVEGLALPVDGAPGEVDAAPDVAWRGVRVGREVLDDGQPDRRHRVAGGADGQPQRGRPVHAEGETAADDLLDLSGEPGLVLGQFEVGRAVHRGDDVPDRRGQLGAHRDLVAGVRHRAPVGGPPAGGRVKPRRHETVAHDRDDRMRGVPRPW
jgi:hypothetical protein